MTDLSGATLYAATDDPTQAARKSTIQWLNDSGLDQDSALGTSPGSLNQGSLDSASRLYPKGVPQSNPWARELDVNYGSPSNIRRIPSVDLISAPNSFVASPAGLGVPIPEPQSNASSASNGSSQIGEVKL